MALPAPAEIGMPLEDVDTPALLIDLDAFESNVAQMADHIRNAGIRSRPHAKTHKCAEITKRQMAAGAVGACCQKVSEARALAENGVDNILVSNQVVGARKLANLANLAKDIHVGICADHPDNIAALNTAAANAGVTLNVLVEIDVGSARCGVAPGAPAVELALQVRACDNLYFEGLQAYQGRAQHIRSFDERREAINKAVAMTQQTVDQLGDVDIACETVAGAGTGTFGFEAASGLYNELQTGSYVFMDADYARNRNADGSAFDTFAHSLFVYATVMSLPKPDLAVIDAGLKASSVDSGLPVVRNAGEGEFVGASDEHGKIDLSQTNHRYQLGDKLHLIPGHCDPTVNLYDWYVCVRNGVVEDLWPIVARGALY